MGFTFIVWSLTLLNTLIGASILFRPALSRSTTSGPIRIGPVNLVAAVAGVSALGVIELPIVAGSIFGAIHLVYLQLVALVPVLGILVILAALWRRNSQRRFSIAMLVRLVALVSLLAIPCGVWASFVEPFRLQLEQSIVTLPAQRDAGQPIKVAVLSDLQTDHVGAYEHRAVDLAMQQKPDIILLPGDLWQGDPNISPKDLTQLQLLLRKLSAPGGVYFARGNCEVGRHIENYLAGTEVRLLTNEIIHTQVHGQKVTIAGVELDLTPEAKATVRQLEDEPGDADVRILMSHYPDHIRTLKPNSRIDLVVAGHTHGGQIAIPGWGPPVTLSHVPREAAAGGLHTIQGNRLYVSRGIGWEHGQAPRIRLFCPPEVSLLTLEPMS